MATRLSQRVAAVLATACLGVSTMPAAASAEGEASTEAAVTPYATSVVVSVSCTATGSYGWNVTLIDGPPNTTQKVYRTGTAYFFPGSGGGDFATVYMGLLSTGSVGIGTSSTFYGNAGLGATGVKIYAHVAGIEASDYDAC